LTLTVKHTAARLRLELFDGAVFTVRLVPEGRFAPVVAIQGDTPIGFASFDARRRPASAAASAVPRHRPRG
jgi:hypothetical protein